MALCVFIHASYQCHTLVIMTPARDSESYVQRYKLYSIVLPVCTAISSIGNFARARPHPHRMMIVISRGQTILHNQNGDRLIFGAMGRQRGRKEGRLHHSSRLGLIG